MGSLLYKVIAAPTQVLESLFVFRAEALSYLVLFMCRFQYLFCQVKL